MNKKFLPIGTVVRLKKGKKKLMVTGFLSAPLDDRDDIHDYCGCFYPEGLLRTDQVFLFNHKQIEVVLHKGYVDDEEKEFKTKLSGYLKAAEHIAEKRNDE